MAAVSSATARAPLPGAVRSAATSSRTAGATSWAKIWIARGSSLPRMNVVTPCSSVSPANSSTHCSGGPARKPADERANVPFTLSMRRISAGSRPAA